MIVFRFIRITSDTKDVYFMWPSRYILIMFIHIRPCSTDEKNSISFLISIITMVNPSEMNRVGIAAS